MRAVLAQLVFFAGCFLSTPGFSGVWDVDGSYAWQLHKTRTTSDWGGSFYVHPRYWFDSDATGFGVASHLALGNNYELFGGPAWRAGHTVFFEAAVGGFVGAFGNGGAVMLQLGTMVGKDAELSYAIFVASDGRATFLPYIGMRL
jgi:hypothetical protein